MKKMLLSALLASVAIPAFAADMPVKAPIREPIPYVDWSGVYVGVGAGFGWGREKLDHDLSGFDTGANSSLFGTGIGRVLNGNPVLLAPAFALDSCVIDNCNSVKSRGFIAGGFAGAQKQMGNWVLGLEVSFDATGMKKSFGASQFDTELVNRISLVNPIVPGTLFLQTTVGTGETRTDVVSGVPLGANGTIPAGSTTVGVTTFDANGKEVNVNGTVTPGTKEGTFILTFPDPNDPKKNITITSTTPLPTTTPTPLFSAANVGTTANPIIVRDITAPLPLGTLVPVQTQVRAQVTRSVSLETKVDEIADLRGKIGLTNLFFGPNILLYATGGASIGHFTKTLSISQQVQGVSATGALVGTPRTDTFSASSGDTRLGWVVGAGLDWKFTENLILGALYRHHEFPKGTVSFSDGTNTLGFGSSRQTVDSIQGRLSVLFPIH